MENRRCCGDWKQKTTPNIDGPAFTIMGRRKIRCVLTLLFGLSICTVFLVYFLPLDSTDGVGAAVRSEDVKLTSSRWILPWKKPKGSDKCKTNDILPDGVDSESVIDTGKMYESLDFNVEPGTKFYWNKTFEERYLRWKKARTKDLPLEVIVVPNSHIDPGWLRTYDEYYQGYVIPILNNMASFLNKTEEFTFIWSEMSYFSMWWKDLSSEEKETVRRLLKRRQLEIVTGGWVMADEATSHYWSVVDQMVEGQQFVQYIGAGVLPDYGWSVDVFGHSSSMPTLLEAAGMKGMVILRVHYAWRTFLAGSRALDFSWDTGSGSQIPCHMAPSDLYSIKHACGPDPNACLQFDFRNIPAEYSESIATSITQENIEPKAKLLLGQYERFASLYPHNVLLIPLGDDFRYNYPVEWEQQYQNYKKLFEYISHKNEDVRVRFGTVADYFEEVARRTKSHPELLAPFVRGDFLPYADIYSDGTPSYWTGFYSSRPFAKVLARELEYWLRTTEILYSYSLQCAKGKDKKLAISDYNLLMGARHSLAVFHHHDAITGTSKYFVMEDYIRRLHVGINEAMTVATHAVQHILLAPTEKNVPRTSKLFFDSIRTHPEINTKKTTINLTSKGRKIVIFNSLTFHRKEIVRVRVRTLYVVVLDDNKNKVDFQMNPVFNATADMMSTEFELLFVCDIGPLSFKTYTLKVVPKEEWDVASKAEVTLYIADQHDPHRKLSAFSFRKNNPSDIEVDSNSIEVKFNEKGLLKEVYLHNEGIRQPLDLDFFVYTSKPHVSGAYLFNPYPDGPIPVRKITDTHPVTRIVRGRLVSEVSFSQSPIITVTSRIYHFKGAPGYIDIDTKFDISKMDPGIELVMRIKSAIKSRGVFATDSNGLRMSERKRAEKLPVQGNYYPVTSASYIEDNECRLNLLTGQSHGLTSPSDGILEVMLDRRIVHDDLRGLSEGVLDNKLTETRFRLILEGSVGYGSTVNALTRNALIASRTLLYPLTTIVVDSPDVGLALNRFVLAPNPWPLNAHLVSLKTLPQSTDFFLPGDHSLLIILNDRIACEENHPNLEQIGSYLVNVTSVERTSLTGVRKPQSSGTSEYGPLSAYNVAFSAG